MNRNHLAVKTTMHIRTSIKRIYKTNTATLPNTPLYSPAPKAGKLLLTGDPDYMIVDLNKFFVRDSTASYLVEVEGDSMVGANIADGDFLSVDCSQPARNKDIVIAYLNGQLVVKRYITEFGITYLVSENPHYAKLEIQPSDDFEIIGVVLAIHKHLK